MAIQLGLAGYDPVEIDTSILPAILATIKPVEIIFLTTESLPYHPNALIFPAGSPKQPRRYRSNPELILWQFSKWLRGFFLPVHGKEILHHSRIV